MAPYSLNYTEAEYGTLLEYGNTPRPSQEEKDRILFGQFKP